MFDILLLINTLLEPKFGYFLWLIVTQQSYENYVILSLNPTFPYLAINGKVYTTNLNETQID